MFIYRISQTKYAASLETPGISGRWNSNGNKMTYTAGAVALACLEVLAHKTGTALSSGTFSVAIIDTMDLKVEEITVFELEKLHIDWGKLENYSITQQLGDAWLDSQTTVILKVPSAIIDLEYNFLVNQLHTDYSEIKVRDIHPFSFDPRLKSS